MRHLVLLLVVLASAAGCGRLSSEPPPDAAQMSGADFQVARLDRDLSGWPADRLEFQQVRITGDVLEATVSYGGGCAEHTFALVFANVFLESLPVQMRGLLSHDARGDPCRALLTRTLRFDLTPLKEAYRASYRQPTGTIILQGNWERPLRYDF